MDAFRQYLRTRIRRVLSTRTGSSEPVLAAAARHQPGKELKVALTEVIIRSRGPSRSRSPCGSLGKLKKIPARGGVSGENVNT